MISKILTAVSIILLNVVVCSSQVIPTPKEHFGFNIGDDYQLANYTQTEAYVKKLAAASDRTKLVDIGLTEEGRHQFMLIISSSTNIRNLDRYKEISQKLARAEDLTDEQAHTLATEGKAVVWIDGGLHATEVVGAHQLIETMYQLVSRKDPETLRILDEAIILFVHANPDGQELVSNWYMKDSDVKKRKTNIPRLYEKYIGHDNNRDFFMMNMKETQNISKQQYIEWMPQVIYNHHQTGPAGSVLAGPPYRDPFNYAFDPLLVTSIDAVGAAMNNRLNLEGKPGYTQRAGSSYSTWWNGGLRTTAYFHNMVGLLTEIIGGPTPAAIPLVPSRLIPNGATPNPVVPQEWHFRQSIDYSVSLNYAVLNYSINQKQDLLYGIYKMGKNSIEKGNRDTWTLSPRYIDSINNAFKKDQKLARSGEGERAISERDTVPTKYFDAVYKDPTLRDPRGYIISADQPDFPTAVKFINALIYSGIGVHRASADFTVAGKKYPSGSYIIKTSQAFRPHILDMFEPQDHPNDFQYPGGPPIPPYDAAGWTLAYEMGIHFDRILNAFDGPFQKVPYGQLQSPKGLVTKAASDGYVLSAASNNSFIAVNDLIEKGVDVYRLSSSQQKDIATGSFYFEANSKTKPLIEKYSNELGLKVTGLKKRPPVMTKATPLRIALWDTYGGSISSGWVRWIFEQYHFPFTVIYSKDVDNEDLRQKYDVLVFVSGAIPAVRAAGAPNRGGGQQPKPEEIPAELRERLGRITQDTSIPRLKSFMATGGKIVTIGTSANLAYHIGLPVRNALVEVVKGQDVPLPGEKYYIPGSIMNITVDTTSDATLGMPRKADVYFDASPVFKIAPGAIASGDVKSIAWFASGKPLRSGWAWGQAYLQDGIAAFEAKVGAGKLVVFGPEVTFRGQTHGTFKLLFNQLYRLDQK
ncbi:M14 family metallopeptidase [Segetibacter aerophilus]|uniref:Peptidase n=1 Tax=Segetibacter aerophilus TaxID=670293 RepID=A0A512BG88_9BACT|nr:M14 metallopeptidase family protein [Segetibacter aerophilus]GEO10971.1 peptidase [Segetibacter aerophilus]